MSTGGELFVKFRGPPNLGTGKKDIWVYSSSDGLYKEYEKAGITPSTDVKGGQLDKDGDVIDTIKIKILRQLQCHGEYNNDD